MTEAQFLERARAYANKRRSPGQEDAVLMEEGDFDLWTAHPLNLGAAPPSRGISRWFRS
jgi:hypothetical protein